ncbi:hypothetical protein EPN87_01130 [archaeon]|nr:MAG: hypothetical protein EPN87_01130 [archaeon]
MKERLKKLFNSWIGAILYVLIGLFILTVLMHTGRIELYILVVAGVPVLFAIQKQDWLPYIFAGIIFALALMGILGAALSTSFPLVSVISGSLDHGINEDGTPCRAQVSNYSPTFDNWWQACSQTYAPFNITKQQFSQFPFSDGLGIGYMAAVQKQDAYKVGDIIVYDVGQAAPIIHRVVMINPDGTYQTKGDHNMGQNSYEHSVDKSRIAGKVIFAMPLLGYVKVFTARVFGV